MPWTPTVPTLTWPTVRVGDEGLVVEVLQRLLGEQGQVVAVSGFFDDATEDAVRTVEAASNVPVDGIG
ncbi:MAG: peptidoglycan-binding protein [Ilumatobacteraceae bacterium]